MSYARWNRNSDVYVYRSGDESHDQWITHVTDQEDMHVDISATACADRLEALRSVGYKVEQYAIDWLRHEDQVRSR